MFGKLIARLWKDESGAVVAAEYLMLGSVVAVGGTGGLVAMRDSVIDEYKEFGASIGETRRAHTPGVKPTATPAAPVLSPTTAGVQAVPTYTFSHP